MSVISWSTDDRQGEIAADAMIAAYGAALAGSKVTHYIGVDISQQSLEGSACSSHLCG
ncbi:hypothetical protein [Mesorhizobium sp. 131-3-5]|uniref:hypothetical protein n=1 Tax=Mesorhizobium sp. 131-3-5 TaxID=2744520 RepID=UPI001927A460|nr:hypothetical protein [Mesorhizobium sp. 131-3-5]